jgi:hypothetical protein
MSDVNMAPRFLAKIVTDQYSDHLSVSAYNVCADGQVPNSSSGDAALLDVPNRTQSERVAR